MLKSRLSRRWKNAFEHTWPQGTHQLLWNSVFGAAGGFIMAFIFGGAEFAWAELKSYALFTLAGVGLVNILSLARNWWLAPARIEKEHLARIKGLEDELAALNDKIANRIVANATLRNDERYLSRIKFELSIENVSDEPIQIQSLTVVWTLDGEPISQLCNSYVVSPHTVVTYTRKFDEPYKGVDIVARNGVLIADYEILYGLVGKAPSRKLTVKQQTDFMKHGAILHPNVSAPLYKDEPLP